MTVCLSASVKRQLQICRLAIDAMNEVTDTELDDLFGCLQPGYRDNSAEDVDPAARHGALVYYPLEHTRALRLSGGKLIFPPTVQEYTRLCASAQAGVRGDYRTAELLLLALEVMDWKLDELADIYYYEGEDEAKVETHCTFNGRSFRIPTAQEIWDVSQNVRELSRKYFPPCKPSGRWWDVWDFVGYEDGFEPLFEVVDSVHYEASACRYDVERALIEHDGYNPSIICALPAPK